MTSPLIAVVGDITPGCLLDPPLQRTPPRRKEQQSNWELSLRSAVHGCWSTAGRSLRRKSCEALSRVGPNKTIAF